MVFVRSNGTFAVEYDEDGSPKEDRIAESRLRRRLNNNDNDGDRNGSNNNRNGSNDSNNDFGRYQDRAGSEEEYADDFHHQDSKFEAGDIVFAQTGGWGRKNWTRVTVDAYLGKGLYRVKSADGSGTKELDSKKLRYLKVYLVHNFSLDTPFRHCRTPTQLVRTLHAKPTFLFSPTPPHLSQPPFAQPTSWS